MTTDLLDFPPIEAPPAPAAKPPAALVVSPPADALVAVAPTIKDTVLAQFKEAAVAITALADKYRDVAFDVATAKGMAEARAARLELRETGRFAVQRAEKTVKADVNDLKRVMADEVERLVAIVQPVEDAIDAQIKAEEVRKAAAKAERERIEAERVARHEAGIAKVRAYLGRCQEPGMTAARIAVGIAMLEGVTFGPEWQEFAVPAASAQCETIEAMRGLGNAAAEREAEAVRLELQRIEREAEQARQAAENARVAAELAERQRAMDLQAAEFRANLARIKGHQQRIDEIHAAATGHAGKTAWELFEAIVAVEALDVSEGQYQEFSPLARFAQTSTLSTLRAMHATATAAEALATASQAQADEAVERERLAAETVAQRAETIPAETVAEVLAGVDLLRADAADQAAAAIQDMPAVDLLGDPVAELAEEDDSELAQCRYALAHALAMLDDLIRAHATKREATALFARVSALRDLGGLPRSAA